MTKYYFKKNQGVCYNLQYWHTYLREKNLKELELFEAIINKGSGHFYCTIFESTGKIGEGCGKECEIYSPRNKKSGICTHHRPTYIQGEKKIIIKNKHHKDMLKEIQKLCNGIEYSRHVPKEAEQLARENNIIIIVGGSDDLMYCYGAKSYLTDYIEHGAGSDGEDLTKSHNKKLRAEAKQLGLKIFWNGEIEETGETIENYNSDESGAFSYKVNKNIESLDFKVLEEKADWTNVYCTGIVIKLPDNFKSSI